MKKNLQLFCVSLSVSKNAAQRMDPSEFLDNLSRFSFLYLKHSKFGGQVMFSKSAAAVLLFIFISSCYLKIFVDEKVSFIVHRAMFLPVKPLRFVHQPLLIFASAFSPIIKTY